jgi:putative endonuclease
MAGLSSMYRVYVIQNPEHRQYIGVSEDIGKRLNQHNSGISTWTKHRGPWTLIWQSADMNLSEALKLEKLLKRQKGGAGFYKITGLPRS